MYFTHNPYQHTIQKPQHCCGIGLHSGRTVNLTIHPAPVNSGIRFRRSDLPEGQAVRACKDNVIDTRLATTIGEGATIVSTTEHLLAALSSYGIDNAEIELDSAEVPIMDGSAAPFMHLLRSGGRQRQEAFRKILRITKEISFADGDTLLSVTPHNGFKVTGEIDFDDTFISRQSYTIELSTERFIQEISRARTFGYVEQVEELWANGLALGTSLENVIAIHWNRKSVLNEEGLRYKDEFIRHKVLDIIGDLSLLGCPLLGHIRAYKSGHSQHLAFMHAITDSPECWDMVEMKQNGAPAAGDRVFPGSKAAAGDVIMPFLRPTTAPAS